MDKAGQAAWVRGPRQADSHDCPPSRGVKPFCPALVITALTLSHFIPSVFPFLVAGLGEGLATRYRFDFLLQFFPFWIRLIYSLVLYQVPEFSFSKNLWNWNRTCVGNDCLVVLQHPCLPSGFCHVSESQKKCSHSLTLLAAKMRTWPKYASFPSNSPSNSRANPVSTSEECFDVRPCRGVPSWSHCVNCSFVSSILS